MAAEVFLEQAEVASSGICCCSWLGNDELYNQYHHQEWGMPVVDDQKLFEKFCLEIFNSDDRSDLNWVEILQKREEFRISFADFDFAEVAGYGKRDVNRLLKNEGIISDAGKIEATIHHAQKALELVREFGSLSSFFWGFESVRPKIYRYKEDVPAQTPESTFLCQELKKRGWSYVEPATCYAFMQAAGIVNDHLKSCNRWDKSDRARLESTCQLSLQ